MEWCVYSYVPKEVILRTYLDTPSTRGADECRFEQSFVGFYVAFQRGLHSLISTLRSDDALPICSKVDGTAFTAETTSTIVTEMQFILENFETL